MNEILSFTSYRKHNFNENSLIEICKNLVRKDFEIVQIQDSLNDLFNNVELYSHFKDELSSVEVTIFFAFGLTSTSIIRDEFFDIVECSFKLALSLDKAKGCKLGRIKQNAEDLVELIFKASKEKSQQKSKIVFLQSFIEKFPHLDLSEVYRLLDISLENKRGLYGQY